MGNRKKNSEKTLSKCRILGKSMHLFLRIKGPLSLAAGVIGLPMAVLPLLLSRQLQRLTDRLFLLMPGQGGGMEPVVSALLFLGALFALQLLWQLLDGYVRIRDQYHTQEYIKETVLKHVCTVHYSYLENRDDFHNKIAFADAYACREVAFPFCRRMKASGIAPNGLRRDIWRFIYFISVLPRTMAFRSGGLSMEENKNTLRERISVIFQDFAHYEASLRENITVSDPDRTLSDEEILELARQIHVEDVILEQPDGLDGMLGHLSETSEREGKYPFRRTVAENRVAAGRLPQPGGHYDSG